MFYYDNVRTICAGQLGYIRFMKYLISTLYSNNYWLTSTMKFT